MAEIILINPRFEISFWGLEHALPLIGKRSLCRSQRCLCSQRSPHLITG